MTLNYRNKTGVFHVKCEVLTVVELKIQICWNVYIYCVGCWKLKTKAILSLSSLRQVHTNRKMA